MTQKEREKAVAALNDAGLVNLAESILDVFYDLELYERLYIKEKWLKEHYKDEYESMLEQAAHEHSAHEHAEKNVFTEE